MSKPAAKAVAAEPRPEINLRDWILDRLVKAGRPLRPAELLSAELEKSVPYATVRLAVLNLISDGKVKFEPDWRLSVKAEG